MLYLIGSIILTSYLTIFFKIVENLRLDNFQVIVFNYITCVITGSIVNGHFPITLSNMNQDWFKWAMLMGLMFISLFNLIAFTAQKSGVAVTSVANKLSMVIPFLFAIFLYNESVTSFKVLGILIALVAVLLTCWPKRNDSENKTGNALVWILPTILFIGSGLLDTLIKFVEHQYLNGKNNNDYLVTAFASAGAIGTILLAYKYISGQLRFSVKALLMGIALGIPNYFSIWCLVKVLKDYSNNSSAIFPINNMGIVLFSTIVAWLAFKEKLTLLNWIGVLLSLAAIALIAFG